MHAAPPSLFEFLFQIKVVVVYRDIEQSTCQNNIYEDKALAKI